MTFPYGAPSEATYAQCDPLIVDLVRRINDDGRLALETVQSCEGHPWPMLELHGTRESLMVAATAMLAALPEKVALALVVVVRLETQRERWRFTVIPTQAEPGKVAEARNVLAAPWAE
jgi:hypothetical protein